MGLIVRPDFQKPISALRAEWEGCTKCELGERRVEVNGNFVFGEGVPRRIMLIGEGPGQEEEKQGRPFIGPSGKFLRNILNLLGVLQACYVTNVVSCRSCGPTFDPEGNLKMRKNWTTGQEEVDIKDRAPLPSQMNACLPRLYEEIYLVDPFLIVALGGPAAEALTGKASSVMAESGMTKEIVIPGAGFHPNLTDKKKSWVRKVRGELIMPVDQNVVRYQMMTVIHPSYVLRKRRDNRLANPRQLFLTGLKRAADMYEQYMLDVYGDAVSHAREITDEEVDNAMED